MGFGKNKTKVKTKTSLKTKFRRAGVGVLAAALVGGGAYGEHVYNQQTAPKKSPDNGSVILTKGIQKDGTFNANDVRYNIDTRTDLCYATAFTQQAKGVISSSTTNVTCSKAVLKLVPPKQLAAYILNNS